MDELSGGQRQRVWIAMLLAQETPILLLEPWCRSTGEQWDERLPGIVEVRRSWS